jgi:hypothetical protein
MPACPVCDTDNPQTAVECASCGRVLRRPTEVPGFAPPIEGLDPTLHAAAAEVHVERVPELEPTAVATRSLRAPEERLEVERTPYEANGAPQNWSAGPLELDRGRDEDQGPRTAPPVDSGACPWCGAASSSAVCDSCGRHRARHFAPPIPPPDAPARAAASDAVLCPACFARVPPDARCPECGVPLPVREA